MTSKQNIVTGARHEPIEVRYTPKLTPRVAGRAPPAATMVAWTLSFRVLAARRQHQSGAGVCRWLVGLFH
jgi:hypothetical protein